MGGLATNQAFLRRLSDHPAFVAAELDTAFIARHGAELTAVPDLTPELAALAALATYALQIHKVPVALCLPMLEHLRLCRYVNLIQHLLLHGHESSQLQAHLKWGTALVALVSKVHRSFYALAGLCHVTAAPLQAQAAMALGSGPWRPGTVRTRCAWAVSRSRTRLRSTLQAWLQQRG